MIRKLLLSAALLGAAYVVVVSLPDLRRYLKLREM
jgi:uncharacterized protein DUF6893